jgi:hypothetical protein
LLAENAGLHLAVAVGGLSTFRLIATATFTATNKWLMNSAISILSDPKVAASGLKYRFV